jgi:hypothetical protein
VQKENQRKQQEQGEDQHKAEEVLSRSFKTGRSPRVVVESFNGNLTVEANLEGVVDTRLIKQSEHTTEQQAHEGLKNIDLTMTQDRDTVRIAARRLQAVNWPGLQGVSAVLRVPPEAVLELRTSNGSVTVTDRRATCMSRR